MSGTKNNSKEKPIEEVIPLDDIDDDPSIIVIEDKNNQKRKIPVYFECSEEFEAFEGDYVEDNKSSNS